ncbi:single-stranded DNA-binding protein [Dactylosporangium sp. CA-139066]|uniref:single-stranded DNA-binding protein n=1 Tax=Dactylosporangium sp. CA-139066 TaxID=3239930 RepID=UPI003D943329
MLFSLMFEGNLAADPKLHFTQATGKAVAELRVVHNRRRRTKDGEWVDGAPMFITVTAWEGLAERVAELRKGDTVIVEARDDLDIWAYTRQETQEPGGLLQVTAANVALSMRFKGATVTRDDDTAKTGSGEAWDAEFAQELEPAF